MEWGGQGPVPVSAAEDGMMMMIMRWCWRSRMWKRSWLDGCGVDGSGDDVGGLFVDYQALYSHGFSYHLQRDRKR